MIGFDLNVIGRPPTSVEDDDFTLLVKDGNVHRQEQEQREDTGLLRASCERYLKDLYEPLPEPISRELGDRYASLVKTFIDWCKPLNISAIPTDPVFLAQFLHERRMAGDHQDLIGEYADAIGRANNVVGYADPTQYQLCLSVISNLTKGKIDGV